jgi:hypothetical protein
LFIKNLGLWIEESVKTNLKIRDSEQNVMQFAYIHEDVPAKTACIIIDYKNKEIKYISQTLRMPSNIASQICSYSGFKANPEKGDYKKIKPRRKL